MKYILWLRDEKKLFKQNNVCFCKGYIYLSQIGKEVEKPWHDFRVTNYTEGEFDWFFSRNILVAVLNPNDGHFSRLLYMNGNCLWIVLRFCERGVFLYSHMSQIVLSLKVRHRFHSHVAECETKLSHSSLLLPAYHSHNHLTAECLHSDSVFWVVLLFLLCLHIRRFSDTTADYVN